MSRTLTIHVISDSIGDTAAAIAAASVSQFPHIDCVIKRLANVSSIEEVKVYVNGLITARETAFDDPENNEKNIIEFVIFYTFASPTLINELEAYLAEKDIVAVDLFTPAISAIVKTTGEEPLGTPGLIRRTDKEYFERVEAMEFAVDHDDGRNPEQLAQADIVLIGVSRTSKTPLSIYLAMHGYRVANVPLAPETSPPKELFEIEPARVFGLMSQAKLLSEIRRSRLGNALTVAGDYADPLFVQDDLDQARAVMRRIGCIVIRTDNRAIEETAQEILRYYETAFPTHKPPGKQYY